jgi:cytochrome P450
MPYAVGRMDDPRVQADLRAELDAVLPNNRRATVPDLAHLPLLDSFYWEWSRLSPKPTFTTRLALRDFELPGAEGTLFQIREGDLLMPHLASMHTDERVFGDRAFRFDERRFLDNPKLKSKVFNMFLITEGGDRRPWGCAGYSYQEKLVKLTFAWWVGRLEWRLTAVPQFGELNLLNPAPANLALKKVWKRKEVLT